MEFNEKKSVSDTLRTYEPFAKEGDFIEVTEWANGEGYDITINDRPVISLTDCQLDAINYLVLTLRYKK
jgi:hypothetical protein